jgi:heme a synthase
MQPINPWLTRFAKLTVLATFCLIFLGGMVTSKDAGLSVPDWPTSYGYSMFTFPIQKWVGGIFFEHTHRLLATCVGLMTTILAAWIWRNRWSVPVAFVVSGIATAATAIFVKHYAPLAGADNATTRGLIIMHVNIWSFALVFSILLLTTERDRWRYGQPWLQWLSFGAFLLVCVQGTLGGLRVTEVSIVLAMIHACTAQAFLCTTVIIAAALSPMWNSTALSTRSSRRGVTAVRNLAWVLVGAVYGQLIIGAIMRHLHAGLSIPDFPTSLGHVIPPMINDRVAIAFAHRVGALIVTILTITLAIAASTAARAHSKLRRVSYGIIGGVALQVVLGVLILKTGRDPVIASLHVLNGAGVLTMALLLAIRATRLNSLLHPEVPFMHQSQFQEAHA